MKNLIITFVLTIGLTTYSQNGESLDLSDFSLSSNSSPAFVLLEETPTAIYTPTNLKALVIHALNNFGESVSIEFTPYFFVKKQDRSYYNYMGITESSGNYSSLSDQAVVKQNPFSGAFNTLSISMAYVNKEFSGIEGERKTFSVGARSTLFRLFNKEKVYNSAVRLSNQLKEFSPSQEIQFALAEAVATENTQKVEMLRQQISNEKEQWKQSNAEYRNAKKEFNKTVKPLLKVDGAVGYSALFKENDIDSGTANRFGSWLTAESSLLLNEGGESASNNYFNLFITARYIEDDFNINTQGDFFTNYYRDFGGKIEFEFNKFAFSYEYISRTGSIESERSVGNLSYQISKDISVIGGFGKDFPVTDNLIAIFGVNLGLNFGDSEVSF